MKHKFISGICVHCRIAQCVNDALPRLCIATTANTVALSPMTLPPPAKPAVKSKPLRKLAIH